MTTSQKFKDTLTYISQNVSSALANDLMRRIANAVALSNHDAVVDPLLAGMSTSGAGVFVMNGANRRQALRALLLCQQVYLGRLTQEHDLIAIWVANWPTVTIDHWKNKSETEIKRGISMYMPLPNADADAIVAAAGAHGPTAVMAERLMSRLHSITREDASFPVEGICYRAVQSWMLASGHISLQWFLANGNTVVNGAVTDDNCVASKLLAIFGPGVMTNVSGGQTGRAAIVRGDIVYMYRGRADGTPKAAGQLGHWMLSAGPPFGYGCNNFSENEARGVDPTYARCSITNQLLAMQRGETGVGGPDSHFVRVFKPDQLETFPSA